MDCDAALERYLKGDGEDVAILTAFGTADKNTCCKMFRKLMSETKNHHALYLLGRLCTDGTRCEQNKKAGFDYYMASAVYNNANAQNDLGIWYRTELIDFEKAVYWYGLSAQQNNKYALRNLASMYANGRGVAKDIEKSIELNVMSMKYGIKNPDYTIDVITANKQIACKLLEKLFVENKEKDKLIEEKDRLIEHLKYCPGAGFKEAQEDFNLLQAASAPLK